jgi:outer membrane protein assembly factor BamB
VLRLLGVASAIVHVFGLVAPSGAQDWNQWRGPTRNGVVPALSAAASLPKDYRESWRTEIGESYSSPVISDGRLFAHSRRDSEELVTSLNLTDGGVLWQEKYPAPFRKNQYALRMANGPFATPLVVGNRVFTLGVTAILTAWDTSTARIIWRKDFSGLVDTSKMFCGTASSPLATEGFVVVQVGSDVHGGRIVALDLESGAVKWEWRGLGPGYASPIEIQIENQRQIVTLTEASIVGLNSQTGSELWSIPFPDEWNENIGTAIWTGSLVIVSGTRQGTHAYAVQQTNHQWQAVAKWRNADAAMYMSSPVYGDGMIYGFSKKQRGQFITLDPGSGALRWSSEGRDGDHASMLLTSRHVVGLTKEGSLVFVRRNKTKFEIERRYALNRSETWAMPIPVGNDLVLRDSTAVFRITSVQ